MRAVSSSIESSGVGKYDSGESVKPVGNVGETFTVSIAGGSPGVTPSIITPSMEFVYEEAV